MNALHTWGSWLQVCIASGGSSNGFRGTNGTWYYLDSTPRHLQNGSIVGRVHAQRAGEGMADIGGFKISPEGQVVHLPAEVAELLPARAPELPAPAADPFSSEDIEEAAHGC